MPFSIRKVEYYYTTVKDKPGEAYNILSNIAELGINLLAFNAIPSAPANTQLTIVPEDEGLFVKIAADAGLILEGPQRALLVQGDDELGALARIHHDLYQNDVNVYASSGVCYGGGSYGYLIYVKPAEFDRAAKALGLAASSALYYSDLK